MTGDGTNGARNRTGDGSLDGGGAEDTSAPQSRQGFDLLEDLTPYELRTVCESVAALNQPASFVQIYSSIRELDERGELELTAEEIGEVISAMLEAGYLSRVRARPYEQAKADMTLYALDKSRDEVKNALAG